MRWGGEVGVCSGGVRWRYMVGGGGGEVGVCSEGVRWGYAVGGGGGMR